MIGIKSNHRAKRAAGVAAANLVEPHMTIGIGTGTTAGYFIQSLVARVQQGLSIQAVATSIASENLAKRGGIPILDINAIDKFDLAIDGADEIDPKRQMIKGGGGALLREKIIASMADEMVVIIDETKLVDTLGTFGLPVEILPFGYKHTLSKLESLGYAVSLRENKSDNQNYLADLSYPKLFDNPQEHDTKIRAVPGIVETGFFLNMAGRVLIGDCEGQVEIRV